MAVREGMKRESRPSRETFPRRTERPGEAGLANEARPGLGSRGESPPAKKAKSSAGPAHDRDPLGRDKPIVRPAPREQKPDSMARELERDTGVSGHAAGD